MLIRLYFFNVTCRVIITAVNKSTINLKLTIFNNCFGDEFSTRESQDNERLTKAHYCVCVCVCGVLQSPCGKWPDTQLADQSTSVLWMTTLMVVSLPTIPVLVASQESKTTIVTGDRSYPSLLSFRWAVECCRRMNWAASTLMSFYTSVNTGLTSRNT